MRKPASRCQQPAGIVPEGVELLVGMQRAQRVGPALVAASGGRRRGVSGCSSASLAIARGEKTSRSRRSDDVVVAGQHHRPLVGEQLRRMRAQPLHPGELVVELLGPDCGLPLGR